MTDLTNYCTTEGARERIGLRIPTTAAERILQVPPNAFPDTGWKCNRKMLFSAFKAALFAFHRLNDDKAIITDDLVLEEDRSTRSSQGT